MADDFCPTRELTQTLYFFPFFRKLFFIHPSYFILEILQVQSVGRWQIEHTSGRFIMNDSEDFQEGVNTRIFHNNNYLPNVVNAFLYSFDCAPYSFLMVFNSSTLCFPELDKRRNTLLVLPVSRSCDSMLVILFTMAV